MINFFTDLLAIFYPEVCPACGTLLSKDEKTICLSCRFLMPKTGYETVTDNPMARMFWGRTHLHAVSACYFFAKKGRVQHLIHDLKYKSNRDAGLFLGKEMAEEIKRSALYSEIDFIVPVPLHPKKIRIRGYNQSEILALGMREILPAPLSTDNLVRAIATDTQTKKSREARWRNVKDIFMMKNPEQFANKHILLIDDVITTGSTIEACANVLAAAPGIKISVAAAACAPG
ncbi:MAG: putative amidophosphoribosyltransferase [Bacteroidetes bacterium]|nr:MAG: putative amidophosphoribosyltransferase [Bacteroidota bacterium]